MFALMLISVESFIQSSYGDGHECNCNANVLVSNVKSLMICSCTYSVIVNTHRLGGEGGGGYVIISAILMPKTTKIVVVLNEL